MRLNSLKLVFAVPLLFVLFSCGGGSSDTNDSTPPPSSAPPPTNPTPTPTPTPNPNPSPLSAFEQQKYAARFLNQASFGATRSSIDRFLELGEQAWFAEQLSTPMSSHLQYITDLETNFPDIEIWRDKRMNAWFTMAVNGQDQLRQKVAYALSQIFVISDRNTEFNEDHRQIANYYDMLVQHAFGNYRELLEDVTLSPLMGMFLSMRGNEKPDFDRNIRPDENYAREIMQLFSIGLWELNIDGTPVLDANGNLIPTYNQDIIKGYAHVFTGWNFNGTTEDSWYRYWKNYNTYEPMTAVQAYHDKNEKQLLNGVIVPANQTAEEDLTQALDSIFMHPNVGPFIAKRLIQHLVTSNPSPEYVARVAQTFNSNEQGERGDLGAVVFAILSDEEARLDFEEQQENFGKVKEPILKSVQVMRALSAFSDAGDIKYGWPDGLFNQAPLSAPSVFNFYLPTHMPQGELTEQQMVAPEFSILTENYVVRNSNFLAYTVLWGHYRDENYNADEIVIDYLYEQSIFDDKDNFIEHVNLILFAGGMSDAMLDIFSDLYDQIYDYDMSDIEKIAELIFVLSATPQFAIQR